MPQGLQVWNSTGQLILDTNNSLGVILGVHTITKSSGAGSLTVADLASGTPFFTLVFSNASFYPDISVSGTTISWSYSTEAATYEVGTASYTILYGYY